MESADEIYLDIEDDAIEDAYLNTGAEVIPRYKSGQVDLEAYAKLESEKSGLTAGSCVSWSRVSYVVNQEPYSGVPTWTHNMYRLLTCCIPRQRVPYTLLDDVSGYVKPGMCVLLLGPPGAGKTTFLEMLAGRKVENKNNRLTGDILVNGEPWSSDFKRIAGYVTQEDIHIPTMTVRETVTFSSLLRNHPSIQDERMLQRVQVALEVLGIDHRADTIVGGELLRGVSGGEKKRVSIAVELTSGPAILLLDEPTTGLDSASAYDVCCALRTLANVGVPVICSLLQPSQELYSLFDTVMVMSSRKCIYFGPSSSVLDHFESAGYFCPPNKNVAEFLLDVCTSKGEKYKHGENAVSQQNLVSFYKESPAFSEVATEIMRGVEPRQGDVATLPLNRTYAASDFRQAILCTKRAWQTFIRNLRVIVVRVFRALVIGALLGTLFFQMDFSVLGANNRISLLFYCITFTAMGAIASIPAAFEERTVFYHQRALHFYRTFGYFIANLIVDIPMSILEVVLFSSIVYWMTGMYQDLDQYFIHYLVFLLILLLTSVSSKQFCRLCAAAAPTMVLASSVAPAVLCVWLVFAGFLIPRTTIPTGWVWMNWIDPFRYTFEALAINGLQGIDIECSDSEFIPPPSVREGPPFYNSTVCPLSTGDDLLLNFGLNEYSTAMWIDIGILGGFYLTFCVLNFLALAFLKFNSVSGTAPPPSSDAETNTTTNDEGEVRLVTESHPNTLNETQPLLGGKTSGNSDVTASMSTTGAQLMFSNLNYTVVIKKKVEGRYFKQLADLQLLHNINGYAEPGNMVALMGASGAGKSTLLDVLAGRKTGGKISGEIRVNGHLKDQFYNRMVGYVEQFNIFLPTLTVREVLLYNARIRLPETLSDEYKVQRVEEVLDQLGLRAVRDRTIGTPDTGGLSPELRKKLSIGAELVANPKILFLDEPTSGLDSQAAEAVMKVTRQVCDAGVPVICTIHQPSSELFLMFDSLLLMRPGGRTIYFGPMGEGASTVLSYFARFGLECDPRKNPADFVLECSGAGIQSAAETDYAEEWDRSEDKKHLEGYLHENNAENVIPFSGETSTSVQYDTSAKKLEFKSPFAVSMWGQLKQTIKRSFQNKYREPVGNRSYLLTFFTMALLLGTLYWQQPLSQTGARNRVAMLYFLIVFAGLGAIASIPGVILQRAIYYREKPAFLRPFAYFVAQVLAEIPLIIVGSTTLGTVVYFMTGLNLENNGEHFFLFLLMYVVSSLTCTAFAMMIGSIAKTTEVANSLVGISASIFSLFAGFIIPKGSIPWWWKPLHYISFFKYPLEALSINEMIDDTFNCDKGGEVMVPVTTPNGTHYVEPYCPIDSGADFLSYQFTMETTMEYYWVDLVVTVLFLILFTVFIFVGLRRVNHLNR